MTRALVTVVRRLGKRALKVALPVIFLTIFLTIGMLSSFGPWECPLTFAQTRGHLESGSIAPDITLPDIHGERFTLPSLAAGKPLLLTFWSSG